MADEKRAVRAIQWPDQDEWESGEYANTILVNHTPWDFTIFFGRVSLPAQPTGGVEEKTDEGLEPEGILVEPVNSITLSPRTLKELLDVLQTQWKRYVESYGRPGMKGPKNDDGLGH